MAQPIVHVDAFTDKPFAGNPAAVCILPSPRPDAWMQAVAREMNLSETAFLHRENDGYRLRWFTPAVEVDLCGHATLASAHVLYEDGHLKSDETARFHTRSGLLTAAKRGEWIELDFPIEKPEPAQIPAQLRNGETPPVAAARGHTNLLLELASERDVRERRPDLRRLVELDAQGVIVTARASTRGFDFVSRYFAPRVGIDEDPVTGSAHCMLAPYWGAKLGKTEMTGYQASARGGTVRVRTAGDRVILGGQAVTVLRGHLTTPEPGA